MSRRYAIFDAASLGANLDVTRGGIVLTTEVPGLSIARTCRCDVPAQEFESAAEFIVYGNDGTSISNRVSIGVVTADADLDDYVGADDQGLGYRLGEGQIHTAGSSVESAAAGALGDVIGVRYVPGDAGAATVAWYRNGVLTASVDVPVAMQGVPLFLACSLGSDLEPGDLEIQVNSGRDWFEYDFAGPGAGWWDVQALAGTLRFADNPFISSGTDDVPYQRWEGGMTADRITDDRGVHFWIWGRSGGQARASAAVLDVIDSEGRLDAALGGAYRDQPATIRLTDGDYSSGTDVGGYIVDSIVATGPLKRRITLKGPLAQFEVPMLRRAIRPDADPDAVGHYYPMLIGAGFSCPVRLIDKANRIYAVDAMGIQGVGKVRDNGVALDPDAPDYALHAGGQTLELMSEPYGTVTIDAAATGSGFVPPGAPDVLGGDGNPFVGNPVSNWTVVDAVPGFHPGADGFGELTLLSAQGWGRIKHPTAILTAGRSYRWSITVHWIRQHTTNPVIVGFGTQPTGFDAPWWSAQGLNIGRIGIESGGIRYSYPPVTFTGIYTPTVSHAPTIIWRDYANNGALGVGSAEISNVTFDELPLPEDGTEDEIEAEIAAMGRPLEDMLRQGIEVRCRMSPATWDSTSAAAVDAATGYTGQGYWASEQTVLRDYAENLLAPYMASGFEGSDGRLHIARLVDPETVSPDAPDITGADVLNDPVPEWDDMPGLTCSIGCRRNEHVFSADELGDALPWAARPKLTRQYRYVRRYGGPLAPGLEHARAAETLDSRLVIPEDAQDSIDHAGKLASIPREFYKIHVPDAWRWEPGQVARLYLPQWFKDNGGWRNVYIVRVQDSRKDFGWLRVWTRAANA